MQCVSNGKAKFWFSDVVPFSKFQNLIPKLILEYGLDIGEQARKKKSDYGEPVWSLVINYDPAKSEVFQFWLFSTGYREARRSKLTLQEILAQNSSMLRKQKLNSILTTKKEKLLRFGPYVLGQYIDFMDLKPQFSRIYYHPERFGVIFNVHAKQMKTIDSNRKHVYRLFKPFNAFEEKRFESIQRIFGFAFLENEHTHWNQASVSEFLLRRFGIQFDPEVSYNERLKALTGALRGVRKKHLDFFQRHSQKKIRFTWYLSQEFLDGSKREFEKRLNKIQTTPESIEKFAEASARLMAHGNFHGTRFQIGSIQARVRKILNQIQPDHKKLNKKYFTDHLHYVRFTKKKAMSIKQFELACRNADTMYLNKQNKQKTKD
ncbi:hypothetical protein [Acinetobacter parvus]|uniref:Uncharacterized protein n=1 Tax=Acinetobacter parvus NIPH 1103 TaxID=1217671 RepID=N8Q8B6_9GAMM|nr:hypothetical protein F989_00150 [Acinetobacter parvus NIPH 1103]